MNNRAYKPVVCQEQLILGFGNVVVVTGWTPKEVVAKKLGSEHYAAIGNLYSKRGLVYLIANLIVNPFVDTLLALEATVFDDNAQSIVSLSDLFTSEANWNQFLDLFVANSNIGREQIKELQRRIDYQVFHSLRELSCFFSQKRNVSIYKTSSQRHTVSFTPKLKERRAIEKNVNPYKHTIEAETVACAWLKALQRNSFGQIVTGSYGTRREILNLQTVIRKEGTTLDEFYLPTYLPRNTKNFLRRYIPQVVHSGYVPENSYTYGSRIRVHFGKDQIEWAIQKLKTDALSTGVVLNLWDVNKDERSHPPCLINLWLRIVDSDLVLVASFRSHDLYHAFPANLYALRSLQALVASCLDLNPGYLIVNSYSAHTYSDCWIDADSLVENELKKELNREKSYIDQVGNFLISIIEGWIVVEQVSKHDELLIYQYRVKSAIKAKNSILENNPHIQSDHAIYLGIELQKAEYCLRMGLPYTQDQSSFLLGG